MPWSNCWIVGPFILIWIISQAAKSAAGILKEKLPGLTIEASGGITEDNVQEYFDKNIDVVSLSKLTQGYEALDFSMKILKDGRDPRNLPVKSEDVLEKQNSVWW